MATEYPKDQSNHESAILFEYLAIVIKVLPMDQSIFAPLDAVDHKDPIVQADATVMVDPMGLLDQQPKDHSIGYVL